MVAASPALAATLLFCHSLNTTRTPTRPRNNVNSTTRENITERRRRGEEERGRRRKGREEEGEVDCKMI